MPDESRTDQSEVRGAAVDFGHAADYYTAHRAGFPDRFFDALEARGWARATDRALDLGTGTGPLARGLARRGLAVEATDPSREMLDRAVALDREAGVDVEYAVGRAESIDADAASFDLVTAGQCWHWFDRDRAAREVARVLRQGARIVIAHFDWLPLPGNVVEATERLIEQHNPAWTMGGGTGLYPEWLADPSGAGFEELEIFSFDISVPYTHTAWRGRIRASAGVGASLDPVATSRFDEAHGELLARNFPVDPLDIPHRVWAASGVTG